MRVSTKKRHGPRVEGASSLCFVVSLSVTLSLSLLFFFFLQIGPGFLIGFFFFF